TRGSPPRPARSWGLRRRRAGPRVDSPPETRAPSWGRRSCTRVGGGPKVPVGLAIGLRDPGPLAHPAQQARVVVALLVPASPGHDLRQRLPPMPCLRILHRREAALQDQLEVLDPGLEAPREPLEQRISMR